MSHLLDVNTLLALVWPNHQFHAPARRWFRNHASGGWATCAITQLGFVRLSCNPAFTAEAKRPVDAVALLKRLVAHPTHVFVADTLSCDAELFEAAVERLQGHRQTTAAYLAALAKHHGLSLLTFDRRIAAASPFRASVVVLDAM